MQRRTTKQDSEKTTSSQQEQQTLYNSKAKKSRSWAFRLFLLIIILLVLGLPLSLMAYEENLKKRLIQAATTAIDAVTTPTVPPKTDPSSNHLRSNPTKNDEVEVKKYTVDDDTIDDDTVDDNTIDDNTIDDTVDDNTIEENTIEENIEFETTTTSKEDSRDQIDSDTDTYITAETTIHEPPSPPKKRTTEEASRAMEMAPSHNVMGQKLLNRKLEQLYNIQVREKKLLKAEFEARWLGEDVQYWVDIDQNETIVEKWMEMIEEKREEWRQKDRNWYDPNRKVHSYRGFLAPNRGFFCDTCSTDVDGVVEQR